MSGDADIVNGFLRQQGGQSARCRVLHGNLKCLHVRRTHNQNIDGHPGLVIYRIDIPVIICPPPGEALCPAGVKGICCPLIVGCAVIRRGVGRDIVIETAEDGQSQKRQNTGCGYF